MHEETEKKVLNSALQAVYVVAASTELETYAAYNKALIRAWLDTLRNSGLAQLNMVNTIAEINKRIAADSIIQSFVLGFSERAEVLIEMDNDVYMQFDSARDTVAAFRGLFSKEVNPDLIFNDQSASHRFIKTEEYLQMVKANPWFLHLHLGFLLAAFSHL